jgi:hypothetical protein
MTAETGDAEARATVTGVLTDLLEVSEQMPVRADQAEATARIFDRLGEEISEVAAMIRGVDPAAPAGPAYNPWSIISMTTRELARNGVKSRRGPESDLGTAIGHAAGLLDALGVAPVVPADGDTDGQVRPMSADPRVTRARELMAAALLGSPWELLRRE